MDIKDPVKVPARKTPARFPWWGSVLLAIASYCSLKYVVPELSFASLALQKMARAAPAFAHLPTILFLLLAAKQLYDGDTKANSEEKPEEDRRERPEDN